MPKATHQAESLLNPSTPVLLAKGTPLSLRMAAGTPWRSKSRSKQARTRLGSGIGHRSQIQHVASPFIAHGQRLAALAFGSVPPPFEIHGPNLVGNTGFAARTITPRLAAALDSPSRKPPPRPVLWRGSAAGGTAPSSPHIHIKPLLGADPEFLA